MCASMAFMIHQYGTKRYALDRALLMSHPASVGSEGDVDRIFSFISTIKSYTNKSEAEVAKRMGLSFQDYKQKIQNEYWVDAEDALKDNVVDSLVSLSIKEEKTNAEIPYDAVNITRRNRAENKVPDRDFIWMYRYSGKTQVR